MTYRIDLSSIAKAEADAAFLRFSQLTTVERAQFWYQGLIKAIFQEQEMPRRCPIAREDANFYAKKFASFFTGKGSKQERILFTVIEDQPIPTVRILYIRHGAQKTVGEPEVED